MRAGVAEYKMATDSSIPECVFVVGLGHSSSQGVRPISPPLSLVLAITSVTQIQSGRTPVLCRFPSPAVLETPGQCVDVPRSACWRKRDLTEEKQSAQANRLPTGGHVSEAILGDPAPASTG